MTDRTRRARTDQSLRGLKQKYPDPEEREKVADRIIWNTYRTLMTRGMRGCYIRCTDRPLKEHMNSRVNKFKKNTRD
ncbi:MAG: DNA/RNA helicase domain-containing protein [Candidatus Methanomethylophilaceae archaeon]